MSFTVVLINSSGGELDRKTGDDPRDLLRQYADEGCIAGGDTLQIIDDDED